MTRTRSPTTFWALSDPMRIEILDRIAAGSEATVTQLAAAMPITRQAVTRHVGTLREAGLVVGARQGREHRYWVDRGPLDDARRWLHARTTSWERALARLSEHLESG